MRPERPREPQQTRAPKSDRLRVWRVFEYRPPVVPVRRPRFTT
jgi:hypothetical protein